eukprot:9093096-Pyramimonas_sp.AAC.1
MVFCWGFSLWLCLPTARPRDPREGRAGMWPGCPAGLLLSVPMPRLVCALVCRAGLGCRAGL